MAKVQHRFVKLQKLLQVEPYKIVGLWSNGETRLNDFSDEVEKWRISSNRELKKLANPKIFGTAFVKDGTLAFAGSTVRVPGILDPQPVDFDRRLLYTDSELIGRAISPADAVQRNQQRLTYRKRQATSSKEAQEKAKLYLSNINFKNTYHSKIDFKTISQITKKIGTKVRPLFVIGDELIELE